MNVRDNKLRRFRFWSILIGALFVVLVLIATFTLGLTAPLVAILVVGTALVVAAWAFIRFRMEKAAHEASLGRWAVSEAIFSERLRIARDLHDIISHGLGMITVRAATARHLHAQNASEEALLEAIEDVENLSRQATLELRRMLEALRDAEEPAPRHPVDTLASLPELITGAQRAGLQVALDQEDLGWVSPGAQLAICTIVREGLSNCARHAGFTRVQVRLRRVQDAISITIIDDGPSKGWTAAPGSGTGLIGLRERVNSLGGTLYAGPHETGFRIEAIFPEGLV